MIDIHCHLEYMENPEMVLAEARKKMTSLICSIPDPADVDKILNLREKNKDFLFVSLGFHPERITRYTEKQIHDYIKKIKKNRDKIVAIGEAGLDYSYSSDEKSIETQKKIFELFVRLASELNLPLVVHIRSNQHDLKINAYKDVFSILEKFNLKDVVLHCFSGSEGDLKYALSRGYWISFATNICKTKKHPRLAEKTPLNRVLLETDAPWLDPETEFGSKELSNRPWKIEKSAEIIAALHKTTKSEVLRVTTENAKKVFNI